MSVRRPAQRRARFIFFASPDGGEERAFALEFPSQLPSNKEERVWNLLEAFEPRRSSRSGGFSSSPAVAAGPGDKLTAKMALRAAAATRMAVPGQVGENEKLYMDADTFVQQLQRYVAAEFLPAGLPVPKVSCYPRSLVPSGATAKRSDQTNAGTATREQRAEAAGGGDGERPREAQPVAESLGAAGHVFGDAPSQSRIDTVHSSAYITSTGNRVSNDTPRVERVWSLGPSASLDYWRGLKSSASATAQGTIPTVLDAVAAVNSSTAGAPAAAPTGTMGAPRATRMRSRSLPKTSSSQNRSSQSVGEYSFRERSNSPTSVARNAKNRFEGTVSHSTASTGSAVLPGDAELVRFNDDSTTRSSAEAKSLFMIRRHENRSEQSSPGKGGNRGRVVISPSRAARALKRNKDAAQSHVMTPERSAAPEDNQQNEKIEGEYISETGSLLRPRKIADQKLDTVTLQHAAEEKQQVRAPLLLHPSPERQSIARQRQVDDVLASVGQKMNKRVADLCSSGSTASSGAVKAKAFAGAPVVGKTGSLLNFSNASNFAAEAAADTSRKPSHSRPREPSQTRRLEDGDDFSSKALHAKKIAKKAESVLRGAFTPDPRVMSPVLRPSRNRMLQRVGSPPRLQPVASGAGDARAGNPATPLARPAFLDSKAASASGGEGGRTARKDSAPAPEFAAPKEGDRAVSAPKAGRGAGDSRDDNAASKSPSMVVTKSDSDDSATQEKAAALLTNRAPAVRLPSEIRTNATPHQPQPPHPVAEPSASLGNRLSALNEKVNRFIMMQQQQLRSATPGRDHDNGVGTGQAAVGTRAGSFEADADGLEDLLNSNYFASVSADTDGAGVVQGGSQNLPGRGSQGSANQEEFDWHSFPTYTSSSTTGDELRSCGNFSSTANMSSHKSGRPSVDGAQQAREAEVGVVEELEPVPKEEARSRPRTVVLSSNRPSPTERIGPQHRGTSPALMYHAMESAPRVTSSRDKRATVEDYERVASVNAQSEVLFHLSTEPQRKSSIVAAATGAADVPVEEFASNVVGVKSTSRSRGSSAGASRVFSSTVLSSTTPAHKSVRLQNAPVFGTRKSDSHLQSKVAPEKMHSTQAKQEEQQQLQDAPPPRRSASVGLRTLTSNGRTRSSRAPSPVSKTASSAGVVEHLTATVARAEEQRGAIASVSPTAALSASMKSPPATKTRSVISQSSPLQAAPSRARAISALANGGSIGSETVQRARAASLAGIAPEKVLAGTAPTLSNAAPPSVRSFGRRSASTQKLPSTSPEDMLAHHQPQRRKMIQAFLPTRYERSLSMHTLNSSCSVNSTSVHEVDPRDVPGSASPVVRAVPVNTVHGVLHRHTAPSLTSGRLISGGGAHPRNHLTWMSSVDNELVHLRYCEDVVRGLLHLDLTFRDETLFKAVASSVVGDALQEVLGKLEEGMFEKYRQVVAVEIIDETFFRVLLSHAPAGHRREASEGSWSPTSNRSSVSPTASSPTATGRKSTTASVLGALFSDHRSANSFWRALENHDHSDAARRFLARQNDLSFFRDARSVARSVVGDLAGLDEELRKKSKSPEVEYGSDFFEEEPPPFFSYVDISSGAEELGLTDETLSETGSCATAQPEMNGHGANNTSNGNDFDDQLDAANVVDEFLGSLSLGGGEIASVDAQSRTTHDALRSAGEEAPFLSQPSLQVLHNSPRARASRIPFAPGFETLEEDAAKDAVISKSTSSTPMSTSSATHVQSFHFKSAGPETKSQSTAPDRKSQHRVSFAESPALASVIREERENAPQSPPVVPIARAAKSLVSMRAEKSPAAVTRKGGRVRHTLGAVPQFVEKQSRTDRADERQSNANSRAKSSTRRRAASMVHSAQIPSAKSSNTTRSESLAAGISKTKSSPAKTSSPRRIAPTVRTSSPRPVRSVNRTPSPQKKCSPEKPPSPKDNAARSLSENFQSSLSGEPPLSEGAQFYSMPASTVAAPDSVPSRMVTAAPSEVADQQFHSMPTSTARVQGSTESAGSSPRRYATAAEDTSTSLYIQPDGVLDEQKMVVDPASVRDEVIDPHGTSSAPTSSASSSSACSETDSLSSAAGEAHHSQSASSASSGSSTSSSSQYSLGSGGGSSRSASSSASSSHSSGASSASSARSSARSGAARSGNTASSSATSSPTSPSSSVQQRGQRIFPSSSMLGPSASQSEQQKVQDEADGVPPNLWGDRLYPARRLPLFEAKKLNVEIEPHQAFYLASFLRSDDFAKPTYWEHLTGLFHKTHESASATPPGMKTVFGYDLLLLVLSRFRRGLETMLLAQNVATARNSSFLDTYNGGANPPNAAGGTAAKLKSSQYAGARKVLLEQFKKGNVLGKLLPFLGERGRESGQEGTHSANLDLAYASLLVIRGSIELFAMGGAAEAAEDPALAAGRSSSRISLRNLVRGRTSTVYSQTSGSDIHAADHLQAAAPGASIAELLAGSVGTEAHHENLLGALMRHANLILEIPTATTAQRRYALLQLRPIALIVSKVVDGGFSERRNDAVMQSDSEPFLNCDTSPLLVSSDAAYRKWLGERVHGGSENGGSSSPQELGFLYALACGEYAVEGAGDSLCIAIAGEIAIALVGLLQVLLREWRIRIDPDAGKKMPVPSRHSRFSSFFRSSTSAAARAQPSVISTRSVRPSTQSVNKLSTVSGPIAVNNEQPDHLQLQAEASCAQTAGIQPLNPAAAQEMQPFQLVFFEHIVPNFVCRLLRQHSILTKVAKLGFVLADFIHQLPEPLKERLQGDNGHKLFRLALLSFAKAFVSLGQELLRATFISGPPVGHQTVGVTKTNSATAAGETIAKLQQQRLRVFRMFVTLLQSLKTPKLVYHEAAAVFEKCEVDKTVREAFGGAAGSTGAVIAADKVPAQIMPLSKLAELEKEVDEGRPV